MTPTNAATSPIANPASNIPAPALRVTGLSHRYARSPRPALDQVSFTVAAGEVFGLLGPNGSGKTTLFRLLSTMLRPQAGPGSLRIFGCDAVTEPGLVREQLGVVFQNPSLDVKLTAEENLRHGGRLYGLRGDDLRGRIDAALDRFGLADRRRDRVETFSGGMRRRLELAKAMLHEPRLLLLDEPATGLDPGARRDLWRQLHELRDRPPSGGGGGGAGGVTIVLTTHLMDEAERCDRLAVMDAGELVAVDTPDALRARVGGEVVTVTPIAGEAARLAERVRERFAPFPSRGEPTVVDGRVRFETHDPSAAIGSLRRQWPDLVESVTVGRPTLEDAFLHLTGSTFRAH